MNSRCGWKKVVLFGDSITEYSFDPAGGNWGTNIANRLQRRCDVLCRGFTGYNSRSARILLPNLISRESAPSIQAVTIFFGANDACLEDTPTKQNVPLDEYKGNLLGMIYYLESVGLEKHKIIVINPPPYDFEMHKTFWLQTMGAIPSRSEDRVKLYADSCVDVARSSGVQYLDIYNAMIKGKNWKRFLCDGLHLTPEGGEFLANSLWPILEKCVSCQPRLFPEWDSLYSSSQADKDLKDYISKT